MYEYEQDERDVSVLKTVLPLMSRHAAGYHPISYAVWYEYAKGTQVDLHREVDEELRRAGRLSTTSTYTIYSKYLVEPAEKALITARTGLLELVEQVKLAVLDANRDTAGFDTKLNSFQRQLSTATTVQDLGGHINEMLAETQRVGTGFGKLTNHLERSQAEVKRLTDELHKVREDALTDTLSGLLNRRGFDRELQRMARENGMADYLALIMLDIDHFKKVNDTYGHPLGDRVIAAVGEVIRRCVGLTGVAARYGGEEFAVLLPARGAEFAESLAQTIRLRVEEGKIRRRQAEEPIGGVTVSAGVAVWQGEGEVDSLVERADQALYASKRGGRNRVTVYDLPSDQDSGAIAATAAE